MKCTLILIILLLSTYNTRDPEVTKHIIRIFQEIALDSLAIKYFKIDGYVDSVKVDVNEISSCPKTSTLGLPKNLWHYLIDTVVYDDFTKKSKELYNKFYTKVDCDNYDIKYVSVDNLNFHDYNSNINMSYKYLNDSIVLFDFSYKIYRNENYFQKDFIYFYFLITDTKCVLLFKGFGT